MPVEKQTFIALRYFKSARTIDSHAMQARVKYSTIDLCICRVLTAIYSSNFKETHV